MTRQLSNHSSVMPLNKSLRCALAVRALMWAAPLAAQTEAPRPLVITARNLTAEAARGQRGDLPDSAVARPGDVIRYALVFTNVTAGAVKNVQFVDGLPQGLVYVLGSAKADRPVRVEYSIDGGKTYALQPTIVVIEDGRRVEKPAPREAYTHIRWTVLSSLAPAAPVTAEFEAQVAAAPGGAR